MKSSHGIGTAGPKGEESNNPSPKTIDISFSIAQLPSQTNDVSEANPMAEDMPNDL